VRLPQAISSPGNLAEGTGYIRILPGEAVPDVQFVFIIAKLMDHGRMILLGAGYPIQCGLQRPKSRESVSLQSADPSARPQIDTSFLAEQHDVDRRRAA